MFKKKAVAVLCAVMLLALGCACGEEAVSADGAQPLADLVVAASMSVGDVPESVSEDGFMSGDFVSALMTLGPDAGVGITADMLMDEAARSGWLSSVFVPQVETGAAVQSVALADGYVGMLTFSTEENPDTGVITLMGEVYRAPAALADLTNEQVMDIQWLDVTAVVCLLQDESSPCGWKVVSFDLTGEDIADQVNTYVETCTAEYVNPTEGFSILYPADFAEVTSDDANGIQGAISDGSASFSAAMTGTTDKTVEELAEAKAAEYSNARISWDAVHATARVDALLEDGTHVMNLIIVSDGNVYEAELRYAPSYAPDYSLYSEYMMNSFNVDALGLG